MTLVHIHTVNNTSTHLLIESTAEDSAPGRAKVIGYVRWILWWWINDIAYIRSLQYAIQTPWQLPVKCSFSLLILRFISTTLSCPFPLRCGLSGGIGLSPGLGRTLLDQLHHLHHYPPHSGPDTQRRLQQGDGGHHVWRWPSPSLCSRWVPRVRHRRQSRSMPFLVDIALSSTCSV